MPPFSRLFSFFSDSSHKQQRFHVEYTAKIYSDTAAAASLILPIPSSSKTQTIEAEPIFSIPPVKIAIEQSYGNRYALWNVNLEPGKQQIITLKFIVATTLFSKRLAHAEEAAAYATPEGIKYLTPNRFINSQHPKVQEIAAQIKHDHADPAAIIGACNDYVITHLTYGNPIPGLYPVTAVLSSIHPESTNQPNNQITKFDCGGYDTLLVSLLNACGIPARVVSGFWLDGNKNDMHAWVEIMLPDGSWLPADPSVEQLRSLGRSHKAGSLGQIGSDRLITSYGCDLTLEVGETKIQADILQNPIAHSQNNEARAKCKITVSSI
jgi:transglutaminase-like putative cysteine protease